MAKDQNAKSKLDINYEPTGFNQSFKLNEENEKNKKQKINNSFDKETEKIIISPHKQPVEKIILDIRELFFIILEMVIDKKNPLPYIFSSDNRIFLFSIFLLIFGTLLLLLSSLMKSST